MSAQKRSVSLALEEQSEDAEGTSKIAKRSVSVDKWKAENDKALSTSLWLQYDKVNGDSVTTLKCSLCIRFNERLLSCRNYNAAFITGSCNLRLSSVKDHASSYMHERAMQLFKKSQSCNVTDYAPIARALCTMDAALELKMKRKFEIAYMLCKEHMAFTKMSPLCELEEKHGVDLGSGYKNKSACVTFVEFIALELRQQLLSRMGKANFFSILCDGTTDSGNLEEELFVVQFFDPDGGDCMVNVTSRYFSVRQPISTNAEGLYQTLIKAFEYMHISDWERKLVGFGCDGASVNIAPNGLRGCLEGAVLWIVSFWCMAHRLELAIKDALKGTYFDEVDEMLLRAYYLYKKSPKKCRELDDVVASLKECLDESAMPHNKGNRPIRACGTRFVSHKVAALERFIERYGAYLAHLTSLTEDPTVKAADKQRIKGYILRWRNSKMVLGCALFRDLLKPAATLSKVLQDDQLSIIDAIEAVVKTNKVIESLNTLPFEELPSV